MAKEAKELAKEAEEFVFPYNPSGARVHKKKTPTTAHIATSEIRHAATMVMLNGEELTVAMYQNVGGEKNTEKTVSFTISTPTTNSHFDTKPTTYFVSYRPSDPNNVYVAENSIITPQGIVISRPDIHDRDKRRYTGLKGFINSLFDSKETKDNYKTKIEEQDRNVEATQMAPQIIDMVNNAMFRNSALMVTPSEFAQIRKAFEKLDDTASDAINRSAVPVQQRSGGGRDLN